MMIIFGGKNIWPYFFTTRTNPNGFCLRSAFFTSVTLITVSSMTIKSLTHRPNIHIAAQGNSPGTNTPLRPSIMQSFEIWFLEYSNTHKIYCIIYYKYLRRILGIFFVILPKECSPVETQTYIFQMSTTPPPL